jgi:hypothetical protein
MPVVYAITAATAASPTAAFDALEVTLATGVGRLLRFMMWQTTDLGDAAEEVLRVEIIRGHATSGSGGQTVVITQLDSYDANATFAAELLNTTIASTGTPVGLGVKGWNIRTDFDWLFPPGQEPLIRTTERLVVRVSAPADAITVNCSAIFEQL